MEAGHDCGPTALGQALAHAGFRIDRSRLLDVWGFHTDCDRLDTPGHHLRVLRRLGLECAIRRRLGTTHIARAVRMRVPVVFLVPTGLITWHWIVICGGDGESLLVSGGDGSVKRETAHPVLHASRHSALGRVMRIDGLGYVIGGRRPFDHDPWLAQYHLGLARLSEECLGLAEPIPQALRRMAVKMGWQNARGQDILPCRHRKI
jgi:hypothetical protein